MQRLRHATAGVLLGVLALVPLPACTPGAPNPIGAVAGLALSIGASVGSYLLIKEITD